MIMGIIAPGKMVASPSTLKYAAIADMLSAESKYNSENSTTVITRHVCLLEVVFQRAALLVLSYSSFEEIAHSLNVDNFPKPRKRVFVARKAEVQAD